MELCCVRSCVWRTCSFRSPTKTYFGGELIARFRYRLKVAVEFSSEPPKGRSSIHGWKRGEWIIMNVWVGHEKLYIWRVPQVVPQIIANSRWHYVCPCNIRKELSTCAYFPFSFPTDTSEAYRLFSVPAWEKCACTSHRPPVIVPSFGGCMKELWLSPQNSDFEPKAPLDSALVALPVALIGVSYPVSRLHARLGAVIELSLFVLVIIYAALFWILSNFFMLGSVASNYISIF